VRTRVETSHDDQAWPIHDQALDKWIELWKPEEVP